MDIKIVCLDPSLRNLGVAKMTYSTSQEVLMLDSIHLYETKADEHKTVRQNSKDLEAARWLSEKIAEACKGATFAIAEVPVGSQSARAMASYGICVGVLGACPLPLFQVNPTEVKRALTGNATATKSEMIEAAVAKYPNAKWLRRMNKGKLELVGKNEHMADAIAAGHAGIRTNEFKQAIGMFRFANEYRP